MHFISKEQFEMFESSGKYITAFLKIIVLTKVRNNVIAEYLIIF